MSTKHQFVITVFEPSTLHWKEWEYQHIYFEDELSAKIHFEDLKKDKENQFDMHLAKIEEDSLEVIETFVNLKQHEN